MIKEVKNTVPWRYVINDLNDEGIIGAFFEKELQRANKQKFRIEKVIKRKGNKPYIKWKVMMVHGISGLIKMAFNKILCIKLNQYFRKPYEPLRGGSNIKFDLSNYLTKIDLKNATGIDTSKLAAKSDLASLKAEIDKLDIYSLVSVPVNLSKLSDLVKKNKVVKLFITD